MLSGKFLSSKTHPLQPYLYPGPASHDGGNSGWVQSKWGPGLLGKHQSHPSNRDRPQGEKPHGKLVTNPQMLQTIRKDKPIQKCPLFLRLLGNHGPLRVPSQVSPAGILTPVFVCSVCPSQHGPTQLRKPKNRSQSPYATVCTGP